MKVTDALRGLRRRLRLRRRRDADALNDRLERLRQDLRESLDNQSAAVNLRLDRVAGDLREAIENLDRMYRDLHESFDNQTTAANLRLDRLTSDLNDRLDQLQRVLRETLDNQSAAGNLRLDRIAQTFDRHSRRLKTGFESLIGRSLHSAARVNEGWTSGNGSDAEARARRIAAERERGRTFILCRTTHEHDRIIMENMGEYLSSLGVPWKLVEFESPGNQPQLRQCLDDAIGILGLNSQLDHCWLGEENFLDVAAEHNVPVVHWILDHPSVRWPEFEHATPSNSRFLLVSAHCEAYFRRYVFTNSRTAWTAGVGPNWRSHVTELSQPSFVQRDIPCLIAMNLQRLGGALDVTSAHRQALEPAIRDAVGDAIERARNDLAGPLEVHLAAALAERGRELPNEEFHRCFQIVEDTTAIEHRMRIFDLAARFPVLVRTDYAPDSLRCASVPTVRTDAAASSMADTTARMKSCRAVLSANFANDLVHNRTANALNAGCVAIVEDTPMHRRLFEHGRNALLFRYDDDSIAECFDLVCHHPERAYEIARAGFALRDHPLIRFGGFHNAFDLTWNDDALHTNVTPSAAVFRD